MAYKVCINTSTLDCCRCDQNNHPAASVMSFPPFFLATFFSVSPRATSTICHPRCPAWCWPPHNSYTRLINHAIDAEHYRWTTKRAGESTASLTERQPSLTPLVYLDLHHHLWVYFARSAWQEHPVFSHMSEFRVLIVKSFGPLASIK